jgi:hypothetical protein
LRRRRTEKVINGDGVQTIALVRSHGPSSRGAMRGGIQPKREPTSLRRALNG